MNLKYHLMIIKSQVRLVWIDFAPVSCRILFILSLHFFSWKSKLPNRTKVDLKSFFKFFISLDWNGKMKRDKMAYCRVVSLLLKIIYYYDLILWKLFFIIFYLLVALILGQAVHLSYSVYICFFLRRKYYLIEQIKLIIQF